MSNIGAVILAAGASTRLRRPKQLLRLGGETLLERAVRTAREGGLAPIVVVLGAAALTIQESFAADGCRVVLNSAWPEGIASSIRAGAAAVADLDGAVFLTCDMPATTPGHLAALAGSAELTASAYGGRRGVPAYFPRNFFPSLLRLSGDVGARDLLRGAPAVDLHGGEHDIDTEEDYTRAQQVFR